MTVSIFKWLELIGIISVKKSVKPASSFILFSLLLTVSTSCLVNKDVNLVSNHFHLFTNLSVSIKYHTNFNRGFLRREELNTVVWSLLGHPVHLSSIDY